MTQMNKLLSNIRSFYINQCDIKLPLSTYIKRDYMFRLKVTTISLIPDVLQVLNMLNALYPVYFKPEDVCDLRDNG